MDIARSVRTMIAASLGAGAVLSVASIATMPDFSGSFESRLEAVAGSELATLSATTWIASQLFIAIGAVGIGHLLRSRAPVLAPLGAALVVLSCFGHAVYGGVQLAMLAMADEPEHRDTYAALLERLESGVAIPFMAAGLLGLILGYLLLAAALWRTRIGPRWVAPALLAWLILEFVGSSLSAWAYYGSALLYLLIFATLAATVAGSPSAIWRTEEEASPHTATIEPARV